LSRKDHIFGNPRDQNESGRRRQKKSSQATGCGNDNDCRGIQTAGRRLQNRRPPPKKAVANKAASQSRHGRIRALGKGDLRSFVFLVISVSFAMR
jgi:hypothetical protein